jgi:hypothetical protein
MRLKTYFHLIKLISGETHRSQDTHLAAVGLESKRYRTTRVPISSQTKERIGVAILSLGRLIN